MAKIKNATPFDSVQKRFSQTDEIHFRNRKADNATIGVRVKHPNRDVNSAKQIQCKEAFQTAQAAVSAALADETQRAQYEKAWKAHKQGCITLRGYIFKQVYVKPEFA